jgi:hypothetical protein
VGTKEDLPIRPFANALDQLKVGVRHRPEVNIAQSTAREEKQKQRHDRPLRELALKRVDGKRRINCVHERDYNRHVRIRCAESDIGGGEK